MTKSLGYTYRIIRELRTYQESLHTFAKLVCIFVKQKIVDAPF